MPVKFEDYDEDRGRMDLSEGTNADRILSFLSSHPDLGFTPKEIHEETSVPRGSVGATLKRLEEQGLVRHKGNYWAAAEDDQLATYFGAKLGMQAVEDRFGDDYYGQNPGWADDLPDLNADEE